MTNLAAVTFSASKAVDELRTVLEPLGASQSAFEMAEYLRDQFVLFGIKSKPRRAAQKDVVRAVAKQPIDSVLAFCETCWQQDEREFQYAACDLLRSSAKRLEPEHLDDVKRLIVTKSWWDTVDTLAARVVGPVVQRHELGAVMDRWIEDDHLWVARSAILHQLFWKADTDEVRLFEYCAKQRHHQDFFMRKAIGWALRQYARSDAAAVMAFVEEYDSELSGLSKREALKHLR